MVTVTTKILPAELIKILSKPAWYNRQAVVWDTQGLVRALVPATYDISVQTLDTGISGQWSEPIPNWLGGSEFTGTNFPTIDRNGVIHGTVSIDGVLQEHARVYLYYRPTGALVRSAWTNAAGEFRFAAGMSRGSPDYFVVATTDLNYNAIAYDKLSAV